MREIVRNAEGCAVARTRHVRHSRTPYILQVPSAPLSSSGTQTLGKDGGKKYKQNSNHHLTNLEPEWQLDKAHNLARTTAACTLPLFLGRSGLYPRPPGHVSARVAVELLTSYYVCRT